MYAQHSILKFLITSHSEDLPTYCLSLWLQWGSNPWLWPHFNFKEIVNFYLFEVKKCPKLESELEISDLNARVLFNHYTVETIVWRREILISNESIHKKFLDQGKKSKICYFWIIHFSETSGNLGLWPILNQRLCTEGHLLFNATGRHMAA